jgi:DNA repair protein RecO (recombination protein O)
MQKLWVIRKSPYRESSALLTVLTEDNRLHRVLSRGNSRGASRLGEFQPFFADVKVRGSGLGQLVKPEAAGVRLPLAGLSLVSGLYINEIMHWILPEGVEVDRLFEQYTETLRRISTEDFNGLRAFERCLLEAAGSYPDLTCDTQAQPLEPEATYRLLHHQQLVRVESNAPDGIVGEHWIALAQSRYAQPETTRYAKWLHRQLIDHATGGRRLVTREMLTDLGISS